VRAREPSRRIESRTAVGDFILVILFSCGWVVRSGGSRLGRGCTDALYLYRWVSHGWVRFSANLSFPQKILGFTSALSRLRVSAYRHPSPRWLWKSAAWKFLRFLDA
jgi:hypothetical protein